MRPADFDRLYAEHAQPLFSFLAYRLGDRTLAEDLLADTFERALRSHGRFDRRRGSEKSWLYSIALNLVRDHQRRRGAEHRALDRASPGLEFSVLDPALERAEQRSQLEPALAALSEEEREAIALPSQRRRANSGTA